MNLLILEDDPLSQQIMWETILSLAKPNELTLFQAYNLEEAEKIFNANKDTLDVIALDWNVPNNSPNFKDTVALAEYIRRSFNWLMLSISQSDSIQKKFKKIQEDYELEWHDCDWFEILEFKFDLIAKIDALLK